MVITTTTFATNSVGCERASIQNSGEYKRVYLGKGKAVPKFGFLADGQPVFIIKHGNG